ncbi:MAG: hypothetical protein GWN99_03475 [Gemmatimonadetes bacterium]|uniref:Dimethylargininase n=1 Tax=Candidatus Kutchimonas denitrificans TaxID=3056748 RepID=A0AAE4Z7H7_9BACT|nr:hypothetical protein [Gemmatimonadota bacterium]NIR75189.1 hypothetical protein [Candidatus Kutchimonas denitrificans]NIS00127.1 hypothetical protein [Gemmatimonadota bacterium]NIT65719.1 hypothetical protein [Gemmatimonadota bacterium]NIU52997.1 hypothetical protein [Gemmatimonadota bacterium]
MRTPTGTHAIVRGVPATFDRAIQAYGPARPIDVERARDQHARYCAALEELGLELIPVPADDRFPDCPFVEDTAVVIGDLAVLARPGADSRRGEVAAVGEALAARPSLDVRMLLPPATLDGGDVLAIGDRVYVGLSDRTNQDGADRLAEILAERSIDVEPLVVRDVLHLKSACTYLGDDTILWLPGHVEGDELLRDRTVIEVSADERHAANCLAMNGRVLVPKGAPRTRSALEAAAFDTIEIDMTESVKAGAGLTCSSIVF